MILGLCHAGIPHIRSVHVLEAVRTALKVGIEEIDLVGGEFPVGHRFAEGEEIAEEGVGVLWSD